MQDTRIERVREHLASCRRAGADERFEDAVRAADDALGVASSSSFPGTDDRRADRMRAAALGYKGMALLSLARHNAAVLALEESYLRFQRKDEVAPPSTRRKADEEETGGDEAKTSTPPLPDRVATCLVRTCAILGRDPPLPPLVKFPRTPHLFRPANSRAVTDDDLVLDQDDAFFALLATAADRTDGGLRDVRVSYEEKVDGANLGISLGLDGRILVQNRSHYISHGEHAQFSQLAAWTETHGDELRRILAPSESATGRRWRRIIYGEWCAAKHSIPYHRLPGCFVAFDLSEDGRFVSRDRFHDALRGSGIPVAPTISDRPDTAGMTPREVEQALLRTLGTPSAFRADGGPIEGIVIRIDVGGWTEHRCKLVDPEFVAGIEGHWTRNGIAKQRVDATFALEYAEDCYSCSREESSALPAKLSNPRQRAVVSYRRGANGEGSATCAVLPKEPNSRRRGPGGVVLPRNLCWLWPGEVLASSTPKSEEQVRAFRDALDVGLVVTLTQEEPLPRHWFQGCEGCENDFVPVPDGAAPTLREIDYVGDRIVQTVSGGDAALVHCGGGKGRAGTIAACLLLRFGGDGVGARIEAENEGIRAGGCSLRPRPPFMSGEEAIVEIRRRRPGSLETIAQENVVREYAQHLWRGATFCVEGPSENEAEDVGPPDIAPEKVAERGGGNTSKRGLPKHIVLAGLPGSGKSSLARRLSREDGERFANEWVYAGTDELGKRGCCAVVGRVAAKIYQGRAGGIVVDACNVTAAKRREWIDVMHRPVPGSAALVFFDVPPEVCAERVRYRVDHPTLPFGRGERVVERFRKDFELPTPKEKELFGQIAVIRSDNDVSALLSSWGIG